MTDWFRVRSADSLHDRSDLGMGAGVVQAVQAVEIDMPVTIDRIERRIVEPKSEAAEAVMADHAAGNGADAADVTAPETQDVVVSRRESSE